MDASQAFWFFAPVLVVAMWLRRKKVTLDLGILYGALMLLFILPCVDAIMDHLSQMHFVALDALVVGAGVLWVFRWLKIAMKGWMIVARGVTILVLMVLIWIFLF